MCFSNRVGDLLQLTEVSRSDTRQHARVKKITTRTAQDSLIERLAEKCKISFYLLVYDGFEITC